MMIEVQFAIDEELETSAEKPLQCKYGITLKQVYLYDVASAAADAIVQHVLIM